MSARLLIVEDDRGIAELVAKHLQAAGYETATAESGPAALEAIAREAFELIVLDVGLPGLDGFAVARHVRQERRTPILMLTARTSEAEKVLGLELGADDYVTKPFSPIELVARVRAILRRAAPPAEPEALERGALRIDPSRREVTRDGLVVPTTTLEFELLAFLARQPGRVFSRDALIRHVWGPGRIVDGRAVDNLISRLRQKLEADPARPVILQTVWGAGYRFGETGA